MPAVITIGEILADLVPKGKFYILRAGGAVSNVAVNLARLKINTGIISKIGDDFLGKFLLNFLIKNNVNISCVSKIKKYKTGLVFVFLDKKGERDFSFYGNPSADQFLDVKDIKEEYIKGCELLHFGSISMIGHKSRAATLKAIKIAKKYGKKISYDPNVRINLAENGIKKFRENIKKYFKYADIIKISEDELKFLFGLTAKQLSRKDIFRNKIVFVSCGAKGCYVKYNKIFEYVKGYKVKVIDTTGAGDAFMAGIIYKILKMKLYKNENSINKKNLIAIAKFANKIGAKAVTKKGAV